MNLFRSCLFHNGPDIMGSNTSPRQNFDSITSVIDQLLEQSNSLRYGLFLAAGKNPCEAELHELIECFQWIRRHVKSSVKYGFPVSSQFQDLLATIHIAGDVRPEDSKNH